MGVNQRSLLGGSLDGSVIEYVICGVPQVQDTCEPPDQECTAICLAACRIVRNASLTASLFGKAVAMSGSSTAILEAVAAFAAYLPRTKPLGKSECLYSSRKVSLVDLAFFINFPFQLCAWASADDSDSFSFISVRNDKKITLF